MSYTPMQLAEAFIKTGELTDALDALNQQLSDDPNDNNARRLRASVLLRLAEPVHLQVALDDLKQLSDISTDDYVQQSVIYERMNQTANAIQAMQTAYQQSPDRERILERLVELLIHEMRYSEVLDILNHAPQTWRWLMRQADVYVLNNNPTEALTALNQAQTHLQTVFPDLLSPVSRNTMAQIHIARGKVHMTLDNLKAAEADFRDALYHIPDDATLLFNLGLIFARSDKLTRAEKHCKKALDGASPYIREILIEVLTNDERYTELKEKLGV
jgi:tetratricopeptide (TPR) repeat protein